MPEENENLKIQEKKGDKSWLFRIGVSLIVLAVGVSGLIWLGPGKSCGEACIGYLVFLIILFLLGVMGVILILVDYFLKIRKKSGTLALFKKVVVILLILILIWLLLDIIFSTETKKIYGGIGAIIKSEFTCSKLPVLIDARNKKTWCYRGAAKSKGDLRICDKITVITQRWDCYSDIAQINKDETICEKITAPTEPVLVYEAVDSSKEGCYFNVARVKEDPTICEKLTNLETRARCRREALQFPF